MSKVLENTTILELLPQNLWNDPDIIAASAAVDKEFAEMLRSVNKCLTFGDIDNASSEVVDFLAAEMDVEFYDQSFPLAKRRQLVKNAYIYKYYKGTLFAVKQALEDIYESADVREWFQYGGQPYNFKIVVDESLGDRVGTIGAAIQSVKNVRSWLESVIVAFTAEINQNVGIAVRQCKYQIIKPPEPYEGYTASILGVAHYLNQ